MSSEFCNRRTILRLGSVAFASIGTAGCLNGQSSTNKTITMTDDLTFEPKTATIKTGETVKWKNTSDVDHTVTAYEGKIPDGAAYFASGGFESERAARNSVKEGLIAPDQAYEHTFEQPGTFGYFCIPHEGSGMVGSVQVE